MLSGVVSFMAGVGLLFGALPAGASYKLQSYGMGSGGVANSTSSSYALEGISGEVSGTQLAGTTYKVVPGFIGTQQANVPGAPTISNPANYYNKLLLVLNTGNNPSDATFAIAISSNNFATTQYVKADHTVGSSLTITDYQTYASWGGGSGFLILGLASNTTYQVKVRAMHGKFTETQYSPLASGTTANPSITFDLDVSGSDVETSPPYAIAFTDLIPGTVVTTASKIWTDFDTNGDFGGNVYLYGTNAGLRSSAVSFTISSITGNLAVSSIGYGAQSASATQTSGGPIAPATPYDGTSDNVGIADTSIRKLYSAVAPITAGRTSLRLKAKVGTLTPSSNDYSEILTIVGSASF